MKNKTHAFGAVSLALLLTSPAFAQSEQSSASAQRDAANEGSGEEEIVVVAQRRAENLQDVPLSVTAVTEEMLEDAGITSSRELALVTPGLRIDAGGAFYIPTIRGISTLLNAGYSEANIATYIDGVYQQTTIAAFYDLADIEQIEVLKGPQGTLFGRNATGGAILINTKRPDMDRATGNFSVSFGRFANTLAKGFVSVPLSDKVAISLSGLAEYRGSYKHDLLAGGDRRGTHYDSVLVRGKIRVLPWDGADFVLTGMYARREDNDALNLTNLEGNNFFARTTSPIADEPHEVAQNFNSFVNSTDINVALTGNIDIGPGTLTTTTAYVDSDSFVASDGDYSPAAAVAVEIPLPNTAFSQELIYNTKDLGRFNATLGAAYYWSESCSCPLAINNFIANWQETSAEAFAIFGEASYRITDRLKVTAGLRWSKESRDAEIRTIFAPFTNSKALEKPDLIFVGKTTWNALTPRFSILYEVTDRTNIYATYSEGFKSGIYNTTSISNLQSDPVDPEEVKSYEIGIKTTDIRNLNFSAAAFYYDYSDLQISTTILVDGAYIGVVKNAAKAEIYGIEASGTWNVTNGFKLTLGGTWLHGRYESFPNASVIAKDPTGPGNITLNDQDLSGRTMVRAPTFSGNLTAQYVAETEIGEFELAGTLFYSSKVFYDPSNRIEDPAYAIFNASVAWRSPESNLQVRLWGKNLTDTHYIVSTIITSQADAVIYAPPRTYGVEVKYSF